MHACVHHFMHVSIHIDVYVCVFNIGSDRDFYKAVYTFQIHSLCSSPVVGVHGRFFLVYIVTTHSLHCLNFECYQQ